MDPWQGSQHVGGVYMGLVELFLGCKHTIPKTCPSPRAAPDCCGCICSSLQKSQWPVWGENHLICWFGYRKPSQGEMWSAKSHAGGRQQQQGGMKREAEDETRFARGLRGVRQLMSTQPPPLGMSTMQIKRLLAGRGGNGHAARPPTEEPSVSLTSALRFIPLHLQSGLQNPSSQLEAAGGVIGLHGACSTPCGALGWGCSVPILPSTRPRSRVSD